MTLPQVHALARFWKHTPPPAIALKRISLFLGLAPAENAPKPARNAEEALREAAVAGLPVMHGRPDDPMLDLIGL